MSLLEAPTFLVSKRAHGSSQWALERVLVGYEKFPYHVRATSGSEKKIARQHGHQRTCRSFRDYLLKPTYQVFSPLDLQSPDHHVEGLLPGRTDISGSHDMADWANNPASVRYTKADHRGRSFSPLQIVRGTSSYG